MNIIDKIMLGGPYIGDFKEEIISFRPYIKWIYDNIEFKDFYVSSHLNRKFLYDFIPNKKFIPVYEYLTRSENKQLNVLHKDINIKEYESIILRKIRETISIKNDSLKKNIINYGLKYNSTIPNLTILNKSFTKIPFSLTNKKIIFIPDKIESVKNSTTILNHLLYNYPNDLLIIGDKKCHFQHLNIIQKRPDYFEIVYKKIVDYISNALIVICPCSHWTILANQQQSFVVSWFVHKKNNFDNLGKYKTNGVYGFKNNNIVVDTTINDLLKIIDSNINLSKGNNYV